MKHETEIRCGKCCQTKAPEFFSMVKVSMNTCTHCFNELKKRSDKANARRKRPVNCENKTPIFTGYGETKEAKKSLKTRRDIEDILNDRKLKEELDL